MENNIQELVSAVKAEFSRRLEQQKELRAAFPNYFDWYQTYFPDALNGIHVTEAWMHELSTDGAPVTVAERHEKEYYPFEISTTVDGVHVYAVSEKVPDWAKEAERDAS